MKRSAFRAGIGVAILASFLTVWTTIVRDDGGGAAFFMVISAVGVGWFAAGFRAAGMARAMLGVAAMQLLLGMLYATAPITAAEPNGVLKAVIYSIVFALLWLVSANFFRRCEKRSWTHCVALAPMGEEKPSVPVSCLPLRRTRFPG